jgi:tetratricopeptide (TPR) repeat protein
MVRLADYFRHTAAAAMDTAYPYEWERRPKVPPARTAHPDLSEPGEAAAWLDRELPNLLAVARQTGVAGWPEHVWHLSTILYRHLNTRGHYADAHALYQLALRVARSSGHRAGELDALICLGQVYRRQRRYGLALDHLESALEFAQQIGDRAGTQAALRGLGQIHWTQGRYDDAYDKFRRELEIARLDGHRSGETDALIGLAHILWTRGSYDKACDHLSQANAIARLSGDRNAEVDTLRGLGIVYRTQGLFESAREHFHQAKDLAEAIGYHGGVVYTSAFLADLDRIQGKHERAAATYLQILETASNSDDRNLEFEAVHGLGNVQFATGLPKTAAASHRRALRLATELGAPADQARAHDRLAHAYQASDESAKAREHWQRALEILTRLGVDRTEFGEATTASIHTSLSRLDLPPEPADLVEPTR